MCRIICKIWTGYSHFFFFDWIIGIICWLFAIK